MTTRNNVPRGDQEGSLGTTLKRWLNAYIVNVFATTVDATTYKQGGVTKGFITDHHELGGLSDDDHSQYHTDDRGDTRYAPVAKGVTNGDSHDHAGGDGAQVDHGGLAGLSDDDHSQYLNTTRHDTTTRHSLGTVVAHDDHGALGGLADDDHSIYVKADGTRAFTGAEAGLTAAQDDNSTKLATTAYVITQKGTATPLKEGTGAAGSSLRYSPQDHVHPTVIALARLDALVTTTSTTAANITGLSVSVAANETIQFEAYLNNGNTGTTGNKFAVNFPSGGTLVCHCEGSTSGPTAMTQSKITAAATLTTEIYHTLATQVGRATITGTFKNSSTAGTLQLQFAAVTSGTVTINAGSFIRTIRMSSATGF